MNRLHVCFQVILASITLLPCTQAETVKVRHRAGSAHGFLVLRDEAGTILASGELTQMPSGDRLKQRLVFHFRNGSLDDETVIYSQRQTLRLISDHLIQKGTSFPNPLDVTIDARQQQISSRTVVNGKETVKTQHMNLPPDLSNGIDLTLIENLQNSGPRVEVPYLALSGKPRMVKLSIAQEGEEPFSVAGRTYKAMKYTVKVNLGGLSGLVAPLIGKQPADTHVWVSETAVPAIVRVETSLYAEGPVWRIEQANPSW